MLQTTITSNSVLRQNKEEKNAYQNDNIFCNFNLNTFQISVHIYINDKIKKDNFLVSPN